MRMECHRRLSSLWLLFITSLSILFMTNMVLAQNSSCTTISVKVGVVLDHDTWLGKMGLSCINMALSDFYTTHGHYKTRLVLNVRDSKENVVAAAAAVLDLIKNVEVQAVIGPSTSMQAKFVIDLGEKAQVPIISFSVSNPDLTSIRSPYFFRATLNDSSQVHAISALVQAFGWREVVPIYVNDEYGKGIIPYLTDALQDVNARVPYRSAISSSATEDQIIEELYKLMTMETRVFIVHMCSSLASRFFTIAQEVGMMSEGYVWIITDGITDMLSSQDPSVIESMQGILGVKPYVPNTNALKKFRVRWKKQFQKDNLDVYDPQLNIYGLWAYDTATALATAVEEGGTTQIGFKRSSASNNSTDLETFGISLNGPDLLETLSSTKFKSLTGDFFFVNGQLPSSAYQIVNIISEGTRGIGFWTPNEGLCYKLYSTLNVSTYSTSRSSIAPVIWPGESISVPKGWQIPTNGKKLRFLVPVKDAFSEFVRVTRDPNSNTTLVTGFSIDVFDAVVRKLPYALTYEYIPFANPDGTSAGSYNEMIDQVYFQVDALVSDATIIANRSLFVDFTLPYTESGVSMVVPIIDHKSKNAWVFMKPLTLDLWVTILCFFVYIGFVVWVLEHRINEDFRGPPMHQAGTSFWFSFSTMVFAQRERVISNLARVVMIIWCFVMLILTQSYTASLTSLLTVQQLQPSVTDINMLIKRGDYVGCPNGSFVFDILLGLGFNEAKLVIYNAPEDCDELFTKGSGNGGIAAAFDEVPYMRRFLAQHCSKYTMIQPIFKTAGFGFVFPIGSPFVRDMSRAILNITEGDEIKRIEEAWLGKDGTCQDSSTAVFSVSLGLKSFWGLFLIAGVVSLLALLIFASKFIHENRHILVSDPNKSIWTKICDLLTIFNQRDSNSHTFRKTGFAGAGNVAVTTIEVPNASPYSVHTNFIGEQGPPSADLGQETTTVHPP